MQKTHACVMMICFILLQSCSSREVYHAMQENRRLECQELPTTEYEACMQRLEENYEEYKRKREEQLE